MHRLGVLPLVSTVTLLRPPCNACSDSVTYPGRMAKLRRVGYADIRTCKSHLPLLDHPYLLLIMPAHPGRPNQYLQSPARHIHGDSNLQIDMSEPVGLTP